MKIGYARVSTKHQDLATQEDQLRQLGVESERIYVDHGLSGRSIDRPGLRQALAACRAGDSLVVTKLDRLARSVADAANIAQELEQTGVALQIGAETYDPHNPAGRLMFNVFAMIAEFEASLISARTREGMAIAKAKGKLRGKQPKLTLNQQLAVVEQYHSGTRVLLQLGAGAKKAPFLLCDQRYVPVLSGRLEYPANNHCIRIRVTIGKHRALPLPQ
jgi:DNA invertase Pin-like site-specific DNA recombinase